MNIFKIYFTKERLFLEAATRLTPLFATLAVAIFLWLAMFFVVYLFNDAREYPIELSTASVAVDPNLKAGMDVAEFSSFDIITDRFTADGSIWFDFDPKIYSIDDFKSFEFQHSKITYKSEPELVTIGPLMRAVFRFSVNLKSRMNFIDFPLDRHRIDFVVTNILEHREKSLSQENLRLYIHPRAIEQGWINYSRRARAGFAVIGRHEEEFLTKDEHQLRLVFSVFVHRDSLKVSVLSLMPLLLIFLIGLVSLTFDVLKNFNAILSLAVGSLTGFLFYRNVLERLIPPTDQFTIVDKVYILMIVLMALVLGIQIYILHYFRKLEEQTQLAQLLTRSINNINILRGCLFVLFLVVFLLATVFVFF